MIGNDILASPLSLPLGTHSIVQDGHGGKPLTPFLFASQCFVCLQPTSHLLLPITYYVKVLKQTMTLIKLIWSN